MSSDVSSMAEWLTSVGLEKHAERFEEHEITLDVLPHLTEADIEGLGLPIGPRRKLTVEVQRLAEAARAVSSSTRPPSPSNKIPSSSGRTREASGSSRTVERRQLTVMFCDLVGSTALAERLDPEELRELMRAYRAACGDIVARYDGHVAQYLGDGLMVYFGWPTAHEDEAERGVRAALEMVDAVRALPSPHPLAVRIGLATGPVVVGESSDQDDAEARLAIGETPNLAARLQGLANPHEIVLPRSTRRLLGDAFVLSERGEHQLKGIAQRVEVFRVDAVKRTEGRFEAAHGGVALGPLVGRDDETAELVGLWQSARDMHGRAIAIVGEPGIGKSRLLQAFRARIEGRHEELLYQCSPYHVNSALYPITEHLESAAGFTREDGADQRLAKLEALLTASQLDVKTSAPLLAPLLSLPVDRYPRLALSPQKRKEKTLETLARFIEMRARGSALLLVVEDTHWIDPTSEELLELVLERLERLPVLMVTTHRPERAPAWMGRANARLLALSRLDRADGARIALGVTHGRALPEEVLERILLRTDGVPLFVEELTKSLLESGLLREEGDRWSLQASIDDASIPTSLRDSLTARLDRLDGCKEIAQIGACIGREFSYRLMAKVAPLAGDDLSEALERLTEAGLVTRRNEPPAATYTFKHALVQDAAYDSLLKSRRRELHASIARAVEQDIARGSEPEWLAHHHTQAGNLVEAVPLWRRAGALAVERLALREAVGHFEKGLSILAQLPPSSERDRLELTIREPLNAAWTGLRGWAAPEVGENAQAILRLTTSHTNKRSLILALWWMWTTTITQGRIEDSLPWARRMLQAGESGAQGTLDADTRLFGETAMMVQHLLQGELVASRNAATRVLAQYDPRRTERWIQLTGYDQRTFVEVYACQLTWMLGYPDRAVRESDASVAHARTVGHAFNLVWALTFSAYVHAYRRDDEPLFERLEEADRIAKDQGIAFISQVSVPQARGIAHIHAGRPADALPLLRAGLADWTSRGGHVRVPYLKSALAEALALEGELDAALAAIDECLEQIARPGWQEREWLPEVQRVRGSILLRMGRAAEAEAALRSSIECARAQEAKSWELRAATALAELLEASARGAEARALLEPVYAWFTEGFGTRDLRRARMVLDRLGGG
ncbi:MAG: adenylate/guanylate cyclase domain-containing protein [Polyangiaceae bacterium]